MPQGVFKFTDTATGKSYQMPWASSARPTDDEIDAFVKSQEQPKTQTPAPVQQVEESTPWYNKPLTTLPSRAARGLSNLIDPDDPIKGRSTGGLRGVTSAFLESLGNTADEMTTPVNLGMAAVTGGAGLARGAVARGAKNLIPLAKGLRATEAIGSAGMGAQGAYDITQDPTNVGGYVQAGLGALGARGAMRPIRVGAPKNTRPIVPTPTPNPRIRAVSEIQASGDLTTEEVNNFKKAWAQLENEKYGGVDTVEDQGRIDQTTGTIDTHSVETEKLLREIMQAGDEGFTVLPPGYKGDRSIYKPIRKLSDGSWVVDFRDAQAKLPPKPLTKVDLINADAVKQVSDMRMTPKKVLTPEEKLLEAIREAKPIRKQQEKLYSQERAKRIAQFEDMSVTSKADADKRMAALAGELPKIDYAPIKLEAADIDALYAKIHNSPDIAGYEMAHANTGLGKILGEHGGRVPQQSELEILSRVFGSDFLDKVNRLRPFSSKARTIIAKALGTTKAARATLDVSFPLRQGIFYVGDKNFWKSMGPMVRDAFSDVKFEARQKALRERPNAGLGQKSGLDLTDIHANRDEQFVNNYLENIPGIKHLVKGSNRAYVSFGNQLRAGVFDGMIENLRKAGKGVDPDEAKAIAKFINTTTGRGGLGSLEKVAGELNTAVFSPRLASSRLQMIFRPSIYVKGSSEIRKQSIKSLLSLAGFMGTSLGAMKLAGADVDLNPNSADFGKAKFGDVRVDLGGGLLQPLRLASQLMSGEYISKGQERQLGDTYVSPTRLSLLESYGVNKASPIGSFIMNILRGKNNVGEELTVGGEAENLFVPMIIQDIKELVQEDPKLLPLTIPALFGASLQRYNPKSGSRSIRR